jgi:hypothetical protein
VQLDELRYTDFAQAVQELSRDAFLITDRWHPGRTGRSTDRLSLAQPVTAPDGTPALAAEIMLWLSAGAFLAAAWRAVTHDVPAVLGPDLALGPFTRPPAVELRIAA